jgi:hypothetical protein
MAAGRRSLRIAASRTPQQDALRGETGNQHEAGRGKQHLRLAHIAELHQGRWVSGDDAGILKPDQSEEQADAGAMPSLRFIG